MRRLKLLIVAWMLLWLAGNGAMAAVMPFCQHALGGQHSMVSEAQQTSAGHHGVEEGSHAGHQAPTGPGAADQAGTFLGFVCDSCDLCHLASSLAPPTVTASFVPAPDDQYISQPETEYPRYFPEQPQRPPLSRRA